MKDKFGLEDHLPGLVERIVASYNANERTHHIDKQFLPWRIRIIEAVEMLLELLYPGYWGRQHLTSHNVSYHVGDVRAAAFKQCPSGTFRSRTAQEQWRTAKHDSKLTPRGWKESSVVRSVWCTSIPRAAIDLKQR